MTFYLKYRPQTIGALDLFSVRKELSAVLASGRFSHAYLFSGPKGTGKTSAARILAKAVNCEKNQNQKGVKPKEFEEPCNKCQSCQEISLGNAIDLVEIDAASNRGIDDIRELRERIKLAPVRSKFRVYIIDEVHMLTNEAFNALLKTLEEPPAHALFFLCTTEAEKIPATVISRCTQIRFNKASLGEIEESLRKAVEGESLKVDDDALKEIAGLVDGSFRDGMKILEQLVVHMAGKPGKIGADDVREISGIGSAGFPRKYLQALVEFDKEKAFGLLEQYDKQGGSGHRLAQAILEELRLQLLVTLGVRQAEPVGNLSFQEIKRLTSLFSEAAAQIKTAVVSELPLELATAEWLVGGGAAGQPDSGKKPEKVRNKAPESGRPIKQERELRMETAGLDEEGSDSKTSGEKVNQTMVRFEQVVAGWPLVLKRLEPENHSLETLLHAARPVRVGEEGLVVEVAYKFHKEQLELIRYKTLVEAAIREVVAPGLKLKYELAQATLKAEKRREFSDNDNLNGRVEDEEIVKVAEEIFSSDSNNVN